MASVTRNPNGSITVYALIDGYLKCMTYYFCTEEEAVEAFEEDYLNT